MRYAICFWPISLTRNLESRTWVITIWVSLRNRVKYAQVSNVPDNTGYYVSGRNIIIFNKLPK